MKAVVLIILLAMAELGASAQELLTPSLKKTMIDTLLSRIEAYYVYHDVARKMTEHVRKRIQANAYDTVRHGNVLAKLLTSDLQFISHDGHLGVDYSKTEIPEEMEGAPPSQQVIDDFRRQGAANNFAFRKLEVLEGNIGYLKINTFWPGDWIKETAAGAMAMLANSDAIILDLRDNHGFAPDGVILIESYFFNNEVHMTDQINNNDHTTRQYWTLPVIPGNRLADKKLYLLVSHDTFSAGEDFAYNMQAQKRATVIGEATGGGAHGTRPYRISKHFTASIPFSYSVNPITKTDWEGVGMKPDITASKNEALVVAEVVILKEMLEAATADDRKSFLKELLEKRERELDTANGKR